MTEYILYGLRAGDSERYKEELLTVRHTTKDIEFIKTVAAKDGFHSFRVATFKGKPPDFAKTIR